MKRFIEGEIFLDSRSDFQCCRSIFHKKTHCKGMLPKKY